MISENGVVICDKGGIHLYHIPELSTVKTTLSPVWEWLKESEWLYGSVCTTSSRPHPMLYFQERVGSHTITFNMDSSGRDPIVAEHRVSNEIPAHLVRGNHHLFVMNLKGRKGLSYKIDEESTYPKFNTWLLGSGGLAGGFYAKLRRPEEQEHEIRLADFDERTGRILIGTNRYAEDQTMRIYLGDLPL